jgi:hypothetical protein
MTPHAQDGFVPLAMAPAKKPSREDFQVLVAPCPEKARRLGELAPPAVQAVGQNGSVSLCQPKVALHREGDCIIGIQIQCSCGQVIDLSCVYPPVETTCAEA